VRQARIHISKQQERRERKGQKEKCYGPKNIPGRIALEACLLSIKKAPQTTSNEIFTPCSKKKGGNGVLCLGVLARRRKSGYHRRVILIRAPDHLPAPLSNSIIHQQTL
jgi:hypothetical protein